MATGATIRVGDKTDHGGEVVEGFSFFQIDGKPAAGIGHAVTCPKCSGKHYIVGGVDSFSIGGIAVAIDGMKTSCGATLIASQSTHTLEHTSGPVGDATGKFAADSLPQHIASDEYLEQLFVFKHGDTDEPVQGMAYKLTSNGSNLVDNAQLTSGSTQSCSLTNHPNLQLTAWRA
jgi:uncharacterized Zn-binding protein involved in type VI secretion